MRTIDEAVIYRPNDYRAARRGVWPTLEPVISTAAFFALVVIGIFSVGALLAGGFAWGLWMVV